MQTHSTFFTRKEDAMIQNKRFLVRPWLAVLFCFSLGICQIATGQSLTGSPQLARAENLSYLGRTISLSVDGVPLKSVLNEISQKANIRFAYSEDVVPASKGISLHAENVTVAEALDRALEETSVGWMAFDDGRIVLAPKSAILQETGTIAGKVFDDAGAPIPFANVIIEGTTIGAAANARGEYTISRVPPGNYNVRASALGFRAKTESVSVRAGETTSRDFQLIPDILRFEEVVVTGTMSPRQKLESTVAISTISPKELVQANPRSTTEMLRYVPGFTRVESSGGEVNQNISVRGILGVEYVMFMEDGLPVFPTMHTFFMNADNLFRPDENIDRIEVVRGGSSALFGSNTPGAIINFINKTGGPELSGIVKLTAGTEGLTRYDLNINGPLAEQWQFNLGGFYRYDHGVRNPGFPGIRGGQLKASLTRSLSNGFVRISGKLIDDRNQFILPLPFQNPDDPKYVSGFSEYGSMSTKEGNHIRTRIPNGELELPLDDGLRTKAYWLTGDIGFDFANQWSLRNTIQVMENAQGWNAIVPFDVVSATTWAQDIVTQMRDTSGGKTPIVPLNAQNIRYRLLFTNHFDGTGKNAVFNTGNGLLAPSGLWHVEKPLSAFQNQLTLSKTIGKNKFTAGFYFAHYTQTNRWYFTEILMDVRDNPRFVDLFVDYRDPVSNQDVTIARTKNGFRNFLSFYVNGTGQTTVASGVLGAELQLSDQLRADIGFRYEVDEFVQTVENGGNQDLDGTSTTLYDNVFYGNGTFRHFSRSMDDYAASIGLNYKLTDEYSVYVQGSRAFKMPALDEFLFAAAEQQVELFEARRTLSAEAGVKYSTPRFGYTVNGFLTELRNIVGQGAEVNPATGEITWVLRKSPENRSYGVEAEVSIAPVEGLNLLGAGTFLQPQTIPGTGSALTAGGIPDALANISLTYRISDFTLLADWHYVGARDLIDAQYDDRQGRFSKYDKIGTLPAYSYLNLGATYALSDQGLMLYGNILNVFQSTGLEEGNPRLPSAGGRNIFLARPILPRRVTLTLSYQF